MRDKTKPTLFLLELVNRLKIRGYLVEWRGNGNEVVITAHKHGFKQSRAYDLDELQFHELAPDELAGDECSKIAGSIMAQVRSGAK